MSPNHVERLTSMKKLYKLPLMHIVYILTNQEYIEKLHLIKIIKMSF